MTLTINDFISSLENMSNKYKTKNKNKPTLTATVTYYTNKYKGENPKVFNNTNPYEMLLLNRQYLKHFNMKMFNRLMAEMEDFDITNEEYKSMLKELNLIKETKKGTYTESVINYYLINAFDENENDTLFISYE